MPLPLSDILSAVCSACHVTREQMASREQSARLNVARGLFFLIGTESKHHPSEVAAAVSRSRPLCITLATRYRGYLQVRDKTVTTLYRDITAKLHG